MQSSVSKLLKKKQTRESTKQHTGLEKFKSLLKTNDLQKSKFEKSAPLITKKDMYTNITRLDNYRYSCL